MNATREVDRRSFPRHSVNLRVHVTQLGEVNGALARDISEGGLYLESTLPYPVGACVPLRLIHPQTMQQIPAVCEVVRHIRDAAGKLSGLGLRFTNLDQALLERLQALINDVSAPAKPGTPAAPKESLNEIPLDDVLVVVGEATDMQLHPMEAHLLRLVDGKRNADRIAQGSGLSLIEALAGLMQLKRRGLIQAAAGAPPAAESARLNPPQIEAQQGFAGEKVRDYLAEAVRCERGGRVAEAVNCLEQALALDPPNSRDIHVRLCRLAMGPLANMQLARRHVVAIVNEDPDAVEASQLEAEIAAREKEGASAKQKAPRVRVETAPTSVRRKILGLSGAALLLGVIGWNVWAWLIPRGPRPAPVSVSALSPILPCTSARLFKGRLYLTVSPEWHKCSFPRPLVIHRA